MKKNVSNQNKAGKAVEYKETLFHIIFLVSALVSVLSVVAIIVFVFAKGLKPFFGKDAYSFLTFITGLKWDPNNNVFGVFYMIVGSLLATLGAIAFGVPIGLLTAVFIAEIAPKKIVSIIKPGIELLAGIPSVIYGAFGLGVIVPLINKVSPTGQGQSLLAVICVLTIMVLPTIISLSESSIRAVPKSYREASYGLGASKIQTIFKAVIPAARSGILTATVLGIGRAIGETMAVMMIAGNNIGGLPTSIFSKIRPLTTNIAMEMGYASGRHQDMLFATGVILFTFIMAINFTLIRLTKKLGNEGPLR
ncbi:phosphate ABC transporter membrane protein 1, PhoT family (TC 3.A.1.7.1) [Anaerocolumna jejuensis DSM 15929]|uniref:Phosphate transport system permease protein n=1 Tax=Anaerocolumna jejuensis DSM 15929 TaxID=1121322 RepID=A0A1M6VD24_9FIRM|nr:phosphate ABC transporter permease subunit PstC [Anaerocolumna jejuensis]SHK79349.1 phosphate ABC transporter membrane protein 1, PhoT family (TC 3.A.1.7.1) [Anaerocolumna jejuensis DSM 15929]